MPNKQIYQNSSILSRFPWLELIPSVLKQSKGRIQFHNHNLLTTLDVEKMIGSIIRRELQKLPD